MKFYHQTQLRKVHLWVLYPGTTSGVPSTLDTFIHMDDSTNGKQTTFCGLEETDEDGTKLTTLILSDRFTVIDWSSRTDPELTTLEAVGD